MWAMGSRDRTSLGGLDSAFQATRWTWIREASSPDSSTRRAAEQRLFRAYWKPVYCYLRRRGFDNDEAKDLTQGFFCDDVLARGLIQEADRRKGRFRTFLLTALDHYVVDYQRAGGRKKRRPPGRLVSLEGMEPPDLPALADGATPEQAFTCAWASGLVQTVLEAVEVGCRADGMGKHWEVFRELVAMPTLQGTQAPSLRELSKRLGIPTASAASNMNVTVKRRFQAAMREQVRQYAESDDQITQEIRELMEILSKRCAGRS
jgi:RNA polymerase sigma-70 factor (ECF subfamily)